MNKEKRKKWEWSSVCAITDSRLEVIVRLRDVLRSARRTTALCPMWRWLTFAWDDSWRNLDGSMSWANAWALHKTETNSSRATLRTDVTSVQHKMKDTQHWLLQLRIIVRIRGRCACRGHEFSNASGHSTHCWTERIVLRHELTGCQSSKLIHLQTVRERYPWTFGRAILNSLGRSTFHLWHLADRTQCANWVPLALYSCDFSSSCVSHQQTTLSYVVDSFDVSCSCSDCLNIRTCNLELLE